MVTWSIPQDGQWALRDIQLTDDGRTIAQAIRDGTAIAVSDGSFKDFFGTASRGGGDSSPSHRIRGNNIFPGDTEDQGSYRSELSGSSYGITLVIPYEPESLTAVKGARRNVLAEALRLTSVKEQREKNNSREERPLLQRVRSCSDFSSCRLSMEHIGGSTNTRRASHTTVKLVDHARL
jgi:hypothetical protein